VTAKKMKGPLLDTPRSAAFTILELSRLLVLKMHYGFFRRKYPKNKCWLLFSDTDSLCYLVTTDNVMLDMIDAPPGFEFDLQSALPTDESLAEVLGARAVYELPLVRSELKKRKGTLGAFKLENERFFIREFVGLAPKMYSISMMSHNEDEKDEDADSDDEPKAVKGPLESSTCKGVSKRVLKAQARHENYKKMLFSPTPSSAEFNKFQSYKHSICVVRMRKRMLTCFQDKTYQVSSTESRPLGHWRNEDPAQRAADAKEARETELRYLLDDGDEDWNALEAQFEQVLEDGYEDCDSD